MLVALLLYAYARGNRSSRGIERACWEDVAYKVITGMRTPDHSTIAEFRRRHEAEIAELFDDVLGLCTEAGLVSVGVIMIDGTKIKANASMDQNRSYRAWSGRSCARPRRPTGARTSSTAMRVVMSCPSSCAPRRAAGGAGGGQAADRGAQRPRGRCARSPSRRWRSIPSWCSVGVVGVVGGGSGRGSRAASSNRAASARHEPIPRDREDRLFQALGRLEENHRVDLAANEAYERWRATSRDTLGRVLKGNSKPFAPPAAPEGQINLSDPDSRVMRSRALPHRQAYNVQTAVNENRSSSPPRSALTRPTSGIWSRCSTRRSLTCAGTGSPSSPRRSSVTPATGTPGRSRRSQTAGSRCSSRPTARCARAPARLGERAL